MRRSRGERKATCARIRRDLRDGYVERVVDGEGYLRERGRRSEHDGCNQRGAERNEQSASHGRPPYLHSICVFATVTLGSPFVTVILLNSRRNSSSLRFAGSRPPVVRIRCFRSSKLVVKFFAVVIVSCCAKS